MESEYKKNQRKEKREKQFARFILFIAIWLMVALAALGILCAIYLPGTMPEYVFMAIYLGLVGGLCLGGWPQLILLIELDQGGSL